MDYGITATVAMTLAAVAVLVLSGSRTRRTRLIKSPLFASRNNLDIGRSWRSILGPTLAARFGHDDRPRGTEAVPVTVLLELVAAALGAGLPTAVAVEEAYAATEHPPPPQVRAAVRAMRRGVPCEQAWADVGTEHQPLGRALLVAELSGASIEPILRSAAMDHRAHRGRAAQIAARGLAVRLVVPLGLTVLPAFVLLGIAPVVMGLAVPILRSW
ncbi:MAG: type II secretion system F family protein [Angustibacter sp.]